ncbi:MAG: Hsp70 family protein [Polyangia bacterium]
MTAVGLDFGTSNSAIALPSGEVIALDGTSRMFRSVLFFPEDSRETFAGKAAIDEYLARSNGRFIQSVKSWLPSATFNSTVIRGRPMRLDELVALLLRRIREIAEHKTGGPIDRVVLGRPARFSLDAERDAAAEARLVDAAKLAGYTDISLLIEPIAAALAYEATLTKDELVLVADFGAGTSDLTLMRVGPTRRRGGDRRGDVVASGGVPIGGDRFDAEIMRHKLLPKFGAGSTYEVMGKRMTMPMAILGKLCAWHEMSFIKEKSTMQLLEQMLHTSDNVRAIEALVDLVEENLGFRLFRAIEAAKIELSTKSSTRIAFDEAHVVLDEQLTRTEFDRFCQPLLGTLDDAVADLLGRADQAADGVDAVFLTGGSSQIPSVQMLFEQRFGKDKLRSADAFASVAEGLGRATG